MRWNSQQSQVLAWRPLLLFLTLAMSDCPHLALSSLLKATSGPQFAAVSFRLGCIWDYPHCSSLLAFHQDKAKMWSSNIQKHSRYHIHLPPSVDLLLVLASSLTCLFLRGLLVQSGRWGPWKKRYSNFRGDGGCVFPPLCYMSLSYIISNKL